MFGSVATMIMPIKTLRQEEFFNSCLHYSSNHWVMSNFNAAVYASYKIRYCSLCGMIIFNMIDPVEF